jgi:hypothetical protein
VTLQPWGRIEGTFILGGQARANETISLGSGSFRDPDSTRLSLFMSAKTDANGRFVFETVPAGERRVDWRPGFRDGKTGVVPLSHGVPVAVKPGETAQVTLGGTGRLVVGKVVVARRDKPIDWTQDVQSLTLKLSTPPEPVFPKPADFASENEFTAAIQKIADQNKPFWTSDEGKALQGAQRTYVPLFAGASDVLGVRDGASLGNDKGCLDHLRCLELLIDRRRENDKQGQDGLYEVAKRCVRKLFDRDDAGVERGQLRSVCRGQFQKVGIGCPRCGGTPVRELTGGMVIGQQDVPGAQGGHHAGQCLGCLRHSHAASRSLHRNPHEAEFRDG